MSLLNPIGITHPDSKAIFQSSLWQGTRENRTGYWLRWWDEKGELLLWGSERAEQLSERAERLAAQLRAAGIEPEA